MKYEDDVMEIDLLELLLAIRDKIAAILITAVFFAGLAGVYSFFIAQPVYQSTSKLYIQAQGSSAVSLSELQVGSTLAHDCVEMIKSQSIAVEVIESLGLSVEVKDLQKCLSVTNPEETRIINITVEGTDPDLITEIANSFASVSRARISEVMKTDKPQIWEKATVPEKPIKPSKRKNVMMGFLLGGVLAGMVVVLSFLLNDTIKTQEEIERYLELNMLAVVPMNGEKKNVGFLARMQANRKKKRRRSKKHGK
ncbi:MAG: YveK family protein [Anaerovoracaceae bacterium]